MWVFTRYGFFSVVSTRGPHGTTIDPDRVLIRARDRRHLDALRGRFPEVLEVGEIHEGVGTDYAFRMVVEKSAWARVLQMLGAEIDYDNFKSEVASHLKSAGAEYEEALHQVWSVMRRLQAR
jgi:hypothetical protein